ncbi:MAG: hypothetical protein JXA96_08865 [Sedimentisphaerales bacterium]|nr:hypothetical protein [Sedimentisphaerales bacterium]
MCMQIETIKFILSFEAGSLVITVTDDKSQKYRYKKIYKQEACDVLNQILNDIKTDFLDNSKYSTPFNGQKYKLVCIP